MSERLLIIGAGMEQIRAYQIAKKMGLLVVGTDMNPEAPAFVYADDRLIASTRNVSETLKVVGDYAKIKPINGVMTIANDVPLTVAAVANKLKLPGISVDAARIANNKLPMKECFTKHDIATPKYHKLKTRKEFYKAIEQSTFPLILKPSDGRGSRGVLYLEKDSDLEWAWTYALQCSDNKIIMLEEYIAGPQLSVEGIFIDGHYQAIAFADRNYDNLPKTKPYIVEDGGVIPSHFEGKILDQISLLIEKASLSLGISWGTVKADIVISKDRPYIIELAARLSGNYLATHHIPMAYGVEIVPALINLSLGKSISVNQLIPKYKKYLGVRYFFPTPGTIKKIQGVNEVRKRPYLKMLDIYSEPGDKQLPITSHVNRAGTVICKADTYVTAKQRVEEAVKDIKFIVV